MLKFYTTYIIPDLHNSFKQFCQIKVSMRELRCCQSHYMHTGSISASVSVYSNDYTQEGRETVRIPSRLTFIVSHRGHNCIFSALTILDSVLTS